MTDLKAALLEEVVSLLAELGIRYIVGHGNLLEIERVRHGLPPTAHDDDLDVRIDERDVAKLAAYGHTLGEEPGGTLTARGAPCVLNTVVSANETTCVRFGQTTRHHVYDTLRALNQPS